jgi:hypothetical protein
MINVTNIDRARVHSQVARWANFNPYRSLETQINLSADLYNISPAKIDQF